MFLSSFRKKEIKLKEYIVSKNEGILAQGSPTSPKLSNLITINLDKRLTGLANKNGLSFEVIGNGKNYDYLAKLTVI